MIDVMRVLISFGLSLLIGALGYWRSSLTASGWLGAIIVGTATAGLGGWTWGILVVAFFVTSSALSHWRRGSKQRIANDNFAKNERRDLAQTLANGGAVSGLALLHSLDPRPLWFAAALGALATVTADTWGTEIGTLSRATPRLITTGRSTSPGTSGGITLLGLGASGAGAVLIGIVGLVASDALDGVWSLWIVAAALIGGIVGALADSILGATIQAIRWCPHCQVETEQIVHRCGTPTIHRRGWRWLDNDWVNFLASVGGAGASVLIWAALNGVA